MKLLVIALGGLAAMAVASPTTPTLKDTVGAGDQPPFLNDPARHASYHCSIAQHDVIEEYVKVAEVNFVKPIFTCPHGDCYAFDAGATCSEYTATANVKARAADTTEYLHYICSKNRASVLVCRYGFCSTERYCNLDGPGALCQDDCACCKEGGLRAVVKRETHELSTSAASPQTLENKIAPQQPSARADSSDGPKLNEACSRPGIYTCDATQTWIVSCNSANQWEPSRDCFPGHCAYDWDKGTAWCTAKLGLESSTAEPKPLENENPPQQLASRADPPEKLDGPCLRVGFYMCDPTLQAVYICNSLYQWVLSAICAPGHCVDDISKGTAWCVAKRDFEKSARDIEKPATTEAVAEYCPVQGSCKCSADGSKTGSCNADNQFVPAVDCWPGHCVITDDRAYCVGNTLDSTVSEKNMARAPVPQTEKQTCNIPGRYMCSQASCNIIGVCNAVYEWQFTADCRPGRCVDFADRAYCVAAEPGAPETDCSKEAPKEVARVAVPEDPPVKDIIPSNSCAIVGQYLCDQTFQAIGVCNSLYQWVLSADCRPGKCVEPSNGLRYCVAKKPERAIDARAIVPVDQACDKPGAYRCDTTGQRIAVCSPTNEWILSSDCSPGYCYNGPNDTAYCGARKLVPELDRREA